MIHDDTIESLDEMVELMACGEMPYSWGYIRVSSQGQADNESYDVQRKGILEYCEAHNVPTPKLIYDVSSAKNSIFQFSLAGDKTNHSPVSPRPLLLQLIHHLEHMDERKARYLIVWKLDRLSRHPLDQELILRRMWDKGVTVHSTAPAEADTLVDSGPTDDPQRDFFRRIMAAVASFERAMISMRTTAGRHNKAARGGYSGGRPPFGYATEDKELVIDEQEAEVVRYIFQLRIEYGLNSARIAAKLNESGDLGRWSRQKVARLVRYENMYRGKYTDIIGKVHDRPDLKILEDINGDT